MLAEKMFQHRAPFACNAAPRVHGQGQGLQRAAPRAVSVDGTSKQCHNIVRRHLKSVLDHGAVQYRGSAGGDRARCARGAAEDERDPRSARPVGGGRLRGQRPAQSIGDDGHVRVSKINRLRRFALTPGLRGRPPVASHSRRTAVSTTLQVARQMACHSWSSSGAAGCDAESRECSRCSGSFERCMSILCAASAQPLRLSRHFLLVAGPSGAADALWKASECGLPAQASRRP